MDRLVGFSYLVPIRISIAAALIAGACGPSVPGTLSIDAAPVDAPIPIDDAAVPDAPPVDAGTDSSLPDATPDARPCLPDPDGERCNGIDDDCDGLTDEGFPGVGAECDEGVGACERSGSTICTPDGTGVECDAIPGVPETELCETLIDEDCDGLVDEGFALLGTTCTVGMGACQNDGVYICSADLLGVTCNAAPLPSDVELCGTMIDEDCDGLLDEGFPDVGDPCTVGIGACAASGLMVCSPSGTTTQCSAVPGSPASEVCNGIDDDCDGVTDDGNPGGGSSCSTGLSGVCAAGTMTCTGGTLDCVPNATSTTETCNGLDDDCDGTVDDGFSVGSDCDGTDGDLCLEGVIVCNGAGGTTCNDTTSTNSELCNGADDDCDGSIDEGYTLGGACDGPDGDLCDEGTFVCNGAGTGTTCDDATSTNVELCNGVDDDCDGATDEGFTLGGACDGPDGDLCQEGTVVCNAAGTGTTCDDTTGTNAELCDSIDNDCDGTNNEGFTLGGACDGADGDLCQEGTIVCDASGTGTTCNDTTGTNAELCDAIDNDCDGTNNEGFALGGACDGADGDLCQEGTVVCDASGTGTTCNDATGTNAELCNGIDDDCDGSTDEGFVLGAACDGPDGDLCQEGTVVCNASGTGTTCSDTSATDVELCDTVDNDCDGTNNEGYTLGGACDGADGDLCEEGTVVCNAAGTGTTCDDATGTNVELCNGLDDDCDGSTDEGFTLGGACDGPDGDLCQEGTVVCNSAGTGTVCDDTTGTNAELCDTVDNDCDGTNNEGFTLGGACDGADGDLCEEGTIVCDSSGTGTTCSDTTGTNAELCDTVDNDCDGTNNEGFTLGGACDGADGDLCEEGTVVCNSSGTGTTCNDTTGTNAEICNSIDDDCDGTVDEGFTLGAACDGPDGDLCQEGTIVCNSSGTGTTCNDTSATDVELCDTIDNDCDGTNNEGYTLGGACDGPDGDLCEEGTVVCNASGTGTTCDDATGTIVEICNGLDDDCDGMTDEGFTLGGACDGPDGDLCQEGTVVCNSSGTGTTCNDTTGTTVELCDAVDNDCDGTNNEGFTLGGACDGPDGDLCQEGTVVCNSSGTGTTCNDTTGTSTESCNGIDDDCDGSTDEGFNVGAACDGADGDLCQEGTIYCSGGAAACNDTTGTTVEICNALDDDCDGSIDEGINRNDNPLCTSGLFDLGWVSGDTGAMTVTDSWYDEEWDLVTITEDSSSDIYLSATVSLYSPPGTDFDLYVYCISCGGTLAGSSAAGGLTGHYDTVYLRAEDEWGITDTFDAIIEIRYWTSTVCANWSLTVTGNTPVTSTTCP